MEHERTSTRIARSSAAFLLAAVPAILSAQAINDVFDEVGNETYKGGFGAFNWVDATSFGFATNHAGSEAFLSNYTGLPIPNIGFVKPLNGTIANTSYRVSFYCSRYSSIGTPALADYDTLYIGTPTGSMVWDTVPTPVFDTAWVRWSGIFTPAPGDIGQPFAFGCSLPQLISGTSLAFDGPFYAQDINTGIVQRLDAPAVLTITQSGDQVQVQWSSAAVIELSVFDGTGRNVQVGVARTDATATLDMRAAAPGAYVVHARTIEGRSLTGRFMRN